MRKFSSPADGLLRRGRASMLGVLIAAGLAVAPVAAQDLDPLPPADFASGADALQPGQYLWTPNVAPAGPMAIYVDLSRQIAAVYRGGVRIGVTTISSGRPGHETPTGVFTILQKDANHHSNKYDDAPMPFQERLTWDGVALHAGRVPGYPESHGCVHLPYTFAKALFGETRIGMTVVVMNGEPAGPSEAPSQIASAAASANPLDDPSAPATPELSSTRPITLVSSKGD